MVNNVPNIRVRCSDRYSLLLFVCLWFCTCVPWLQLFNLNNASRFNLQNVGFCMAFPRLRASSFSAYLYSFGWEASISLPICQTKSKGSILYNCVYGKFGILEEGSLLQLLDVNINFVLISLFGQKFRELFWVYLKEAICNI